MIRGNFRVTFAVFMFLKLNSENASSETTRRRVVSSNDIALIQTLVTNAKKSNFAEVYQRAATGEHFGVFIEKGTDEHSVSAYAHR